MKQNKTIIKYVNQLFLVGVLAMTSMIYFLSILYSSDYFWAENSIPFKFISVILGYIFVDYIVPGGNVNYYFGNHNNTKDEKYLNSLIIKHRNRFLIALTLVFIIAADLLVGSSKYSAKNNFDILSIDGYLLFIFILFLCSVILCTGTKYLSAWWSIKKNWKKEFKT